MKHKIVITLLTFLVSFIGLQAQTDTIKVKKYQAKPAKTQPFGVEAFKKSKKTIICWTGNAGFLINSRGTTAMVDPLLKGFDMPVLFQAPITTGSRFCFILNRKPLSVQYKSKN